MAGISCSLDNPSDCEACGSWEIIKKRNWKISLFFLIYTLLKNKKIYEEY
jgi:hypothetical protein